MKKALALLLLLAACSEAPTDRAQGYVEGDTLLVAAQVVGRITEILVREGESVAEGTPLARLDEGEAKARLAGAVASHAEASAALEVQIAELERATAERRAAQREFARQETLAKTGVATTRAVDEARRAYDSATARLHAATSGRVGAERQRERTEAAQAEAAWHLAQRTLVAPAAGRIEEIFFRPGEVLSAGRPLLSLLPPDQVKVIAFVPQAVLPRLPVGTALTIRCDGCPAPVPGTVIFVSDRAEFTPPVIYSLETRDKLVFRIDVRPDQPTAALRVGQPVDLQLPPAAP